MIINSKFQRIFDVTNEGLTKAQTMREFDNEAVNWADLCCAEVLKAEDIKGAIIWLIFIEEADPSAILLQSYIEKYIFKELGIPVVVNTEW